MYIYIYMYIYVSMNVYIYNIPNLLAYILYSSYYLLILFTYPFVSLYTLL